MKLMTYMKIKLYIKYKKIKLNNKSYIFMNKYKYIHIFINRFNLLISNK